MGTSDRTRRWAVSHWTSEGRRPLSFLLPLPGRLLRAPLVVVCAPSPWRFGCVAAGVGTPAAYGPSWSGGPGLYPWPVPSGPARGGGDNEGFVPPPPVPAVGRLRVPLAACLRRAVPLVASQPPTLGGERRTSRMHRLLPDGSLCGALPVAVARRAWEWWGCAPAQCGASWTSAGDRRQTMSAGPAGRWGRHGLCPYPRGGGLAVLQEAACSCRAGIGQGSLFAGAVLARRPASLGYEGCLGPSAERMVGGGFCMCRTGNSPRVVAPGGVVGIYGVLFAWEAPGPPGTVVVRVPMRVPGSPRTQGWPRCCAVAWLYGCAGPRVGAIASVARSFRPGYRSPYAP